MMRAALFLLLLACLAAPGVPGISRDESQVEDLGLSPEQMEDRLQALVNEERVRHGLPALAFDPRLRAVAREHCGRMIAAGRLGHDFPGYPRLESRAAAAAIPYSKIGENVARSETFVLRFFHEALLASPSHRENILEREFSHLGVGIAKSGDTYYATQEFARLYDPLPAEEMEARMDERIAGRLRDRTMLNSGEFAAVREYCRLRSLAFLNGVPPADPPEAYGAATVVSLGFTEAETGFLQLLLRLREQAALAWCQGTAFSRNSVYPGGAYAVTLVLFPDLCAGLAGNESPEDRIFASLKTLSPFTRSSGLDWSARQVALAYHRSPDKPRWEKSPHRLFSVYRTSVLEKIPEDVARMIAESKTVRSLGIHAFYPQSQGLPGNYFIVAIVGR